MTSNNCGIYKITNTVTGDFYIGSAVDIRKRWREHRSCLSNNTHCNLHLQNSWNKHGKECFVFTVLVYCEKERLIEREQSYIDSEKPPYNICRTAGNCLGVKRTEETKRKLSKAKTGEKNPNFGIHLSEEHRRKISEGMKGEKNHNFGIHLSEEAIRKFGKANKGRVLTEERRRKMSEARKGVPLSEEHRRKISESVTRWYAERKANV